jgi:beta-lactamase regulating signal transducer with metallopeptidase domain
MMTEFFALPIIQTLGLSLLHFLWQGSIVGILLFVVLCVFRKPQQRYLASCLALLTLAFLPVMTFVNLYEAPKQTVTASQTDNTVRDIELPQPETLQPSTPAAQPQPTQQVLNQSRLTLYLPWLVLVWFVGALILSGKLLLSFLALQRFRSKGVKLAEQRLQLKLLEFAKQLNVKQTITLLESTLVPVPVVLGWLRPVILLPASAVSGLAPKQLEMLLTHELAHVLRRDYLVNVLQSALESLLFYHPVVWWVSAQIRKEREYCCDDIAVSFTGNVQSYAQTLLSLAEMRVQLAPSATGGQLFTRVSRLLQPLETDMKPSYFFAGLSSLGILVALLLTVVNVSVAQEDKAELWVTVVGDVTFSEDYSEIIDTAPNAYIVIEERNGLSSKKFYVRVFGSPEEAKSIFELSGSRITLANGTVVPDDATGDVIIYDDDLVTGVTYTVNGESDEFNEIAAFWYEQALKNSIQHFYPRESEDQNIISAEKYEDEANNRTVYFIAEPNGFENIFSNLSISHWETAPSQTELLDAYREDIRYQTQRYSAGLLKDRSFAGYLDGATASSGFPAQAFPDALEAATELSDNDLKEQLVELIETRSETIPKENFPLFVITKPSVDTLSGQITEKPSPDGKNRISGKVFMNEQPAPFAVVSLSIPLDATVDPGLGIAQTGSNKQGEFSFTGFNIPSGDYIISVEQDNIFTNFIPLLSWESTPDAVRYLVTVYNDTMKEQLVYQMTENTTLALELPLEPEKTYVWTIGAYNKDGKLINAAYGDVFKTE